MASPQLKRNSIHQVTHDLRGPVINVQGFVGELDLAVQSLVRLIEQHRNDLPEAFVDETSSLIKDDFQPCLDYLGKAAVQFEQRINEFSNVSTVGAIEVSKRS